MPEDTRPTSDLAGKVPVCGWRAALLVAADLAQEAGETGVAHYLRETARHFPQHVGEVHGPALSPEARLRLKQVLNNP